MHERVLRTRTPAGPGSGRRSARTRAQPEIVDGPSEVYDPRETRHTIVIDIRNQSMLPDEVAPHSSTHSHLAKWIFDRFDARSLRLPRRPRDVVLRERSEAPVVRVPLTSPPTIEILAPERAPIDWLVRLARSLSEVTP
jgi:hypothetical protein